MLSLRVSEVVRLVSSTCLHIQSFNADRCNSAEQQQPPPPPLTPDEIDMIRHREIMTKSVSAILLLTLRWFKASRKFESTVTYLYFAQCTAPWRCDEVPLPGTIAVRIERLIADSQNVHAAGSCNLSRLESRDVRKQASRAGVCSYIKGLICSCV